MNRRSLLRLFSGAGALAATTTPQSVASVLSSAGVAGAVSNLDNIPAPTGSIGSQSLGHDYPDMWKVRDELYRLHDTHGSFEYRAKSSHISTKKSWSEAFKRHVARKEQLEFEAMIARIEKDKDILLKVADILGVDMGGRNG